MYVNSAPATLSDLYGRYSARLAAHAAKCLAAVGADPVDEVDDVTQEVWLWAAQQRRLPEWEGLSVMTDWVIEEAVKERQARPEIPRGIRPSGAPVVPPSGWDVGLVLEHPVVVGTPTRGMCLTTTDQIAS